VFGAPADITIEASASDSDGVVEKVEFYEGGTKLGEDTSAPYSYQWSGVSAGSYSLTAKATDDEASSTWSGAVAITAQSAGDFLVVGYFPDYRIDSVDSSIGSRVTDLIYFSIEPEPTGELDTSRLQPEHLTKLSEIKNAHGTAILVALGGWGRSDGFAAMATDQAARANFIQNITQFCLDNQFDGADFDWEFPADQAEVNAYAILLVEVKQAFQPHGLLVTVALSSWQELGSAAYEAVDRVHLMSYDHSGEHSTYDDAVGDVDAMLGQGVPQEKLYLGVPFYGRDIDNANNYYTYTEIVSDYHPAPDVDLVSNIYFNGINTIQAKTRYALRQGLGGIMIWEVGQDSDEEDYSLLSAINQALDPTADSTNWVTVRDVERTFILHVPPSYDGAEATPVLFMFHGLGGTAAGAASDAYDWQTTADSNGFIVVFPESLTPPGKDIEILGEVIWEDYDGTGKRWDVAHVLAGDRTDSQDIDFVAAILDWLELHYNIDTSRIFTTGHSYGAYFSYYVAACFPDWITAFAEHSGGLESYTYLAWTWYWPIDVPATQPGIQGMLLHSTGDSTVPYSGSELLEARMTQYGHPVEFITLPSGMGHAWDKTKNQDQWDFFMSYASSVADSDSKEIP